jgi:hypothetical protein
MKFRWQWTVKIFFTQSFNLVILNGRVGLVTSAAGLPSLTYSRTIRDDQNQL